MLFDAPDCRGAHPSLRGRAHFRHCEAEGRGNPSLPTTAAWIASFLAMTEKASLPGPQGYGNHRNDGGAVAALLAMTEALSLRVLKGRGNPKLLDLIAQFFKNFA